MPSRTVAFLDEVPPPPQAGKASAAPRIAAAERGSAHAKRAKRVITMRSSFRTARERDRPITPEIAPRAKRPVGFLRRQRSPRLARGAAETRPGGSRRA